MQAVQTSLFPEPKALALAVAQGDRRTVHSIVHEVLQRQREKKAAAPHCRICSCTEEKPCRLSDGDLCTLRVERNGVAVCSGTRCIKAAANLAQRAVTR